MPCSGCGQRSARARSMVASADQEKIEKARAAAVADKAIDLARGTEPVSRPTRPTVKKVTKTTVVKKAAKASAPRKASARKR